ncbi:MAG: hypothetical protein C0609_07560 [Deltaproteobacteria bacterium]|nr:MAG: hypothetical protein C0609_07560 [Deltaproteobacteria bacterium]
MKRVLKALIVTVSLAFIASSVFAADKPEPAGPNVGDKAVAATFKILSNGEGEINLRDLDKDTLLVMVSSVCSQCKKEIGELQKNEKKIKEKFDIYLVVVDMDPDMGIKRIGKVATLPMISDPDFQIGTAAELMSTPSTIVLAKDGTIKAKHIGYRKNDYKTFLEE